MERRAPGTPKRSDILAGEGTIMTLSSLIASAERGDTGAADALFAALYSELHNMARRKLARLKGGVTLA